ncbi:glycosyltransferase family 4 protein [Chitinophaga ginsengisoli]|nr:glycosyltransferase family 4 protein [Chitinophaga ginsengisoli]
MKKIGFFINTLSKSGGTERVTSVLANALAEVDCEVEVLCMFKSGESFYKLDSRVVVRYLTEKPDGTLKDYFSVLRSLIKNTKHLDYIIGVGMDLCIFTVPLKLFNKVKVIGWEHFNLTVKGPVVSLARHLGIRFADRIVTLTQKDFSDYKKKTDKVVCIYNPTTIDMPPVTTYDNKTLLCVGRLTYQKGFDMMLDIWAEVYKKYHDWKLIIVGNGEDEEALKDQTERLGIGVSVEFVKATKEITKYYATASVYAMTSRYEGLPLVLIEAQSAGLPLIAFNCETGPKEVVEDGYNGFLIPAFDKAAFSEKLQQLMADESLREKMGKQSIINSGKFSRNSIVKKWTEILV